MHDIETLVEMEVVVRSWEERGTCREWLEPLEFVSLFQNVSCDEVNGTHLLHGILKVTM